MKTRTLIASVAIVGGLFAGLATEAHASTPRLGGHCSLSENGRIAHQGGVKLRCTNTGGTGMKWVRTVV